MTTIVAFSEKKRIRRSICSCLVEQQSKASIGSLDPFTKIPYHQITQPVSYKVCCFGSIHGHFLCNFWVRKDCRKQFGFMIARPKIYNFWKTFLVQSAAYAYKHRCIQIPIHSTFFTYQAECCYSNTPYC